MKTDIDPAAPRQQNDRSGDGSAQRRERLGRGHHPYLINGLGIMRDLAVNRVGDRVTAADAQEYLVLIDGVRYTLETELAKLEL